MNAKALSLRSLQVQVKTILIALCMAAALFAMPHPAQAAGLTELQIQAILGMISNFGGDATTIANASAALHGTAQTGAPVIAASVTPSTAQNGVTSVVLTWAVSNAPAGAAIEIGLSGAALNASGDATLPYRNIVSPYPLDGTTRAVDISVSGQTTMPSHGTITFIPSYFAGSLPISGPVNFTVLDSISGNVVARTSAALQVTATPPAITPAAGITVTAPNGGEQWEEGVLNSVTWAPYNYNPDLNPANDVSAYLEQQNKKGEFLTIGQIYEEGKASIHTYMHVLTTPGNYNTSVYPTPGQYYIKVVNNKTGAWDRSDAPFMLLAPTISIKVNGSEGPVTLADNQAFTLSWTVSKTLSSCTIYNVRVSAGSPATSFTIDHVVSGSRTLYASANNYVYMTCIRSDGTQANSNGVSFNVPVQQATLQVTSPNGGEQIPLNQNYTIRWNQKGLSSVAIALYKNDQWQTWINKSVISDKSADDNYTYSWGPSTPMDPSAQAALGNVWKIYITGQKADGTGYVDDKSDAPFSLTSGTSNPTITVTAPNGGEQWQLGVTNSVTWTPYQYNPDINPSKDVSAYLERKCAAGESTVDAQCQKDGFRTLGKVEESGKASIHWITGDLNSQTGTFSQAPMGQYYIRVVNNATGASDRSDAPFTIIARPVDVKVNGSDGPVSLFNNQLVSVTWSSTGGRTACSLAGVRGTLDGNNYIDNLPSAGASSFFAAVDTNFNSNSISVNCRVGNDYGTGVYDVVAVNATAGSAATLQIVSPNGGEQIDPTKQMDITYKYTGIKSFSAALYKNDQWKYWIVKDQPVPGSVVSSISWLPSAALQALGTADNAGNIFKIYITGQKADGTGYVDDKSDAPFSFISTPAATSKFSASLTSGVAPLAVSFKTSLTLPDANSGFFSIDYGDGASDSNIACPDRASNPATCVTVTDHTYTSAGTYAARLLKTSFVTACAPFSGCRQVFAGQYVVGTATITVTAAQTPAITAPTVTTLAVSGIAPNHATLSGTVIAPAGASAQVGFAYSTSATLAGSIFTSPFPLQSGGTATFYDSPSSLSPNTTYYYRAYATNAGGTGYGNIMSFTTTVYTAGISFGSINSAYTVGSQFSWPVTVSNAPSDAVVCLTLVSAANTNNQLGVQAVGATGCYAVSGNATQNFSGILSTGGGALSPGMYHLRASLVKGGRTGSTIDYAQEVDSGNFTIQNGTTNAGALTISTGQQPANSLAPQNTLLPFTKFVLTNTGSAAVTVNSIVVQQNGIATGAAFQTLNVTDDQGTSIGMDNTYAAIFNSNRQATIGPLTVQPGQTRTYTITAGTVANLAAYAGQTVSLSVVALNTSAQVSGGLPVTGATYTLNTTLNCANVTFGYTCVHKVVDGGTLTVSTDASSPAYQIVAGGSTGVTLGVFKFVATGEAINLTRVAINLTSGKSSDLNRIYLYNNFGTLLGTATFIGTNTSAVSTLTTGLNIAKGTDANVIVKGDIANIGVGQSGTSGDLIQVNPNSSATQGTGVSSGTTIALSGNTSATTPPGVRIFRSYPTVALMPLPSTGLADGRLMHFSVTANSSGPVGIEQMSFSIVGNSNANGFANLYAFSDSGFSNPAVISSAGGVVGVAVVQGSGGYVRVVFSQPLEIPAGATYYFELRDSTRVSGIVNGAIFLTTSLLSEVGYQGLSAYTINGPLWAWSPNDKTTSQLTDSDWTNAYNLPGLPARGISQSRSGTATPMPTLTITASPTSITSSQSSTLTWTSTNATTCTSLGSAIPSDIKLSGTVAVSPVASAVYTLSCEGSSGSVQGSATVNVTAPVAPTFVASPASGQAPLTVAFSANAGSDIKFGDGQTGTLNSTSITSYTYKSAGTFTASANGLTQTITVTAAPTPSFSASVPTSGVAPLTVTFKGVNAEGYILNFGDGTASVTCSDKGGNLCSQVGYTHSYSSAGTYYANLSSGNTQIGGTITITVTAPPVVAPATSASTVVIDQSALKFSNNSITGIGGTVPTGVTYLYLSLFRDSSNVWNGTTPVKGGTWSYASMPAPFGAGTYTIKVYSLYDQSTLLGSASITITPRATIDAASLVIVGSTLMLTGTAADTGSLYIGLFQNSQNTWNGTTQVVNGVWTKSIPAIFTPKGTVIKVFSLYDQQTLLTSGTVGDGTSAAAPFNYLSAYSQAFNDNMAAVATTIIEAPLSILTGALSDLFFNAGIY